MTRQPGIWSHLREYEILPPQDVSDKIFLWMNRDARGATGKKEGDRNLEEDDQMNGSLERLSHFEIYPPARLRSSIIAFTTRGRPESILPPALARKSFFFYGIRSVAACLLLIFAGWLLYRATISSGASVASLSKKNITRAPGSRDVVIQHPDSLSSGDSLSRTDSLSEENALAGDLSARDSGVTVAGRYRRLLSFRINGQKLPLVDNDLLASFVDFKYTELQDFSSRSDNGNWKIHLDQYTNISISNAMSGMMKDMSLFKSNGTPTRRRGRQGRSWINGRRPMRYGSTNP